jgi:phenylalanyl-tRNA synthetase alpha chain
MSINILDPAGVRRALDTRDLTDPEMGPHAIQMLVDDIERALSGLWGVSVLRHRSNPVVPVEDNYDRLRYPPDAVARDARYTRYLSSELVLRTHTSAMIPPLLERLAGDPPEDVLLSCPGIVYRRDAIDRSHTGEPHQIDLWRIRTIPPRLGPTDLEEMIDTIIGRALPGRRHRTLGAEHPYTLDGRQIDVEEGDRWLEVGECGLAHPELLASSGLPASSSGLAMGIGLDRMLMLRKGIDDIRILRAIDPRIVEQMLDLDPYRPVSRMPAVRRDISIAISGEVDGERLGDAVREALGRDASSVESVQVVSATPGRELPKAARERLGMAPNQWNVLLQIVLRDLDRTLTAEEANRLRDRIYAALHEGSVHQWAIGEPAPKRAISREHRATMNR